MTSQGISIADIKREVKTSAPDDLMLLLSQQVASGKHEGYISALAAWADENDIDYGSLRPMLPQALKELILSEASSLKMLKRSERIKTLEEFI